MGVALGHNGVTVGLAILGTVGLPMCVAPLGRNSCNKSVSKHRVWKTLVVYHVVIDGISSVHGSIQG